MGVPSNTPQLNELTEALGEDMKIYQAIADNYSKPKDALIEAAKVEQSAIVPQGCVWAVTKGGHSICQPPKRWSEQSASATSAQPVAWRHNLTHTLHDTEDEVQLADGDSWAEPLIVAPWFKPPQYDDEGNEIASAPTPAQPNEIEAAAKAVIELWGVTPRWNDPIKQANALYRLSYAIEPQKWNHTPTQGK